MSLSLEQKNALGIALNEACLLGVEIDPKRRRAAITFQVLTLPSIGGAPSDRRVQLLLSPVGRVAGLLRDGLNAHDDEGRVVALRV